MDLVVKQFVSILFQELIASMLPTSGHSVQRQMFRTGGRVDITEKVFGKGGGFDPRGQGVDVWSLMPWWLSHLFFFLTLLHTAIQVLEYKRKCAELEAMLAKQHTGHTTSSHVTRVVSVSTRRTTSLGNLMCFHLLNRAKDHH